MPKFTENEKNLIKASLLAEGEKLFIQHGLKKVTVDDLVNATGIAKGSFYAFYTNKEHLYTELLHRIQQQEFEKLRGYLAANEHLPPKALFKQYLIWIYKEMENDPLLLQQTPDMVQYLHRKVPADILAQYSDDDYAYMALLKSYGVIFNTDHSLVDPVLESLDMAFLDLISRQVPNRHDVLYILITGVINQIID